MRPARGLPDGSMVTIPTPPPQKDKVPPLCQSLTRSVLPPPFHTLSLTSTTTRTPTPVTWVPCKSVHRAFKSLITFNHLLSAQYQTALNLSMSSSTLVLPIFGSLVKVVPLVPPTLHLSTITPRAHFKSVRVSTVNRYLLPSPMALVSFLVISSKIP